MRKLRREYAEPRIQVLKLDAEDIICTSSGNLDHQQEAGFNDEIIDAGQLGL